MTDAPVVIPPLHKQALAGLGRRELVALLSERGPTLARDDLQRDLAGLRSHPSSIADDACVLVLGGSNGLGRALAVQLLFGEGRNVFVLHNDSERLQIGPHHVAAMRDEAVARGLHSVFLNDDATDPRVVRDVMLALRAQYRCVHLFNSIAAGAPKRDAVHGKTTVFDIDVAMDPVRQVADFSSAEHYRGFGSVEVDVATEAETERTHRLMGTSSSLWADALHASGLLVAGESVVAFADYDFEPDNPVYGMGPLASAKRLQRESMRVIAERYGVRTARVCYPAMNTTAISVIPGGMLTYALVAHALRAAAAPDDLLQLSLPHLAARTMALWSEGFARAGGVAELRLDGPYQRALAHVQPLLTKLTPDTVRAAIALAFG